MQKWRLLPFSMTFSSLSHKSRYGKLPSHSSGLLLSPQEASDSVALLLSINYLIAQQLIMQSNVNYAYFADVQIALQSKTSDYCNPKSIE